MTGRESYTIASSLMIKEKKGILSVLRSINDTRSKWVSDVEIPPEDNYKFVRADIIKMFHYVEAIDKDSCWLHFYMNNDPKFAYLPDAFLNWAMEHGIGKMV